jgi:hypothetical protein
LFIPFLSFFCKCETNWTLHQQNNYGGIESQIRNCRTLASTASRFGWANGLAPG